MFPMNFNPMMGSMPMGGAMPFALGPNIAAANPMMAGGCCGGFPEMGNLAGQAQIANQLMNLFE